MKIRSYFVKNYMMPIAIVTVMYGILGYSLFISKEYLGVFCIVMCTVFILNRRIILYEDRIIVYDGFRRTKIEFNFVNSLKVSNYKSKLAKVGNIPTMFIKMKDNKIKRIYYYTVYSRESMIEIVEYALKKNRKIKLDPKIKALIRNEESEYDIRTPKK